MKEIKISKQIKSKEDLKQILSEKLLDELLGRSPRSSDLIQIEIRLRQEDPADRLTCIL